MGDQQWVKQFGTSSKDKISGAIVDQDGNIFLAGQSQGNWSDSYLQKVNGNGAFLMKVNGSDGSVDWVAQYGGYKY
jgi:hypothetical protein